MALEDFQIDAFKDELYNSVNKYKLTPDNVEPIVNTEFDRISSFFPPEDRERLREESISVSRSIKDDNNLGRFRPVQNGQYVPEYAEIASPVPSLEGKKTDKEIIESVDGWASEEKEKLNALYPSAKDDNAAFIDGQRNQLVREGRFQINPTNWIQDKSTRFAEGAIRAIGDAVAPETTDKLLAENLWAENPEKDEDWSSIISSALGQGMSQLFSTAAVTAAGGPAAGASWSTATIGASYMRRAYLEEMQRSGDVDKALTNAIAQTPAVALEVFSDKFTLGLGDDFAKFKKVWDASPDPVARKNILKEFLPTFYQNVVKQAGSEALLGGAATDFASAYGSYAATGSESYLEQLTPENILKSSVAEGLAGGLFGGPAQAVAQGPQRVKVADFLGEGLKNKTQINEALRNRDFDKVIELYDNPALSAQSSNINQKNKGETNPKPETRFSFYNKNGYSLTRSQIENLEKEVEDPNLDPQIKERKKAFLQAAKDGTLARPDVIETGELDDVFYKENYKSDFVPAKTTIYSVKTDKGEFDDTSLQETESEKDGIMLERVVYTSERLPFTSMNQARNTNHEDVFLAISTNGRRGRIGAKGGVDPVSKQYNPNRIEIQGSKDGKGDTSYPLHLDPKAGRYATKVTLIRKGNKVVQRLEDLGQVQSFAPSKNQQEREVVKPNMTREQVLKVAQERGLSLDQANALLEKEKEQTETQDDVDVRADTWISNQPKGSAQVVEKNTKQAIDENWSSFGGFVDKDGNLDEERIAAYRKELRKFGKDLDINNPIGDINSWKKSGVKNYPIINYTKTKQEESQESQNKVTVSLFRGEKSTGKQFEDTGRTFWTEDEETAKEYGDKIEQREITFNNPLIADNWIDAKGKLNIPNSSEMDDVLSSAEKSGYDGIIWTHNGKKEYVLLKNIEQQQENKVDPAQALEIARQQNFTPEEVDAFFNDPVFQENAIARAQEAARTLEQDQQETLFKALGVTSIPEVAAKLNLTEEQTKKLLQIPNENTPIEDWPEGLKNGKLKIGGFRVELDPETSVNDVTGKPIEGHGQWEIVIDLPPSSGVKGVARFIPLPMEENEKLENLRKNFFGGGFSTQGSRKQDRTVVVQQDTQENLHPSSKGKPRTIRYSTARQTGTQVNEEQARGWIANIGLNVNVINDPNFLTDEGKLASGSFNDETGEITINLAGIESIEHLEEVFKEELFHGGAKETTELLIGLSEKLTPADLNWARENYAAQGENVVYEEALWRVLQREKGKLGISGIRGLYNRFTAKINNFIRPQQNIDEIYKQVIGRGYLNILDRQAEKTSKVFLAMASNIESFRFGQTSDAMDIPSILEAYGKDKFTFEQRGNTFVLKDGNSVYELRATNTKTPVIHALDSKQGGNGSLAYQIFGTWAANNDKRITHKGLTYVNKLRHVSNMISSFLRHEGSTDHFVLSNEQGGPFFAGNHHHNLARLLKYERDWVIEKTPELEDVEYSFEEDTFKLNGVPVSDEFFSSVASTAFVHGIGPSTAKRAVLVNAIEESQGFREVGPRGSNRVLYSTAPSFQQNQTTSDNFKNWFGDWQNNPKEASKVVDKDGKPLVVYHSSGEYYSWNNKDFTHFLPFSHFGTKQASNDIVELKSLTNILQISESPISFDKSVDLSPIPYSERNMVGKIGVKGKDGKILSLLSSNEERARKNFERFIPTNKERLRNFVNEDGSYEIVQIKPEDIQVKAVNQRVYPVYLNIRNPLRIRDHAKSHSASDFVEDLVKQGFATRREADNFIQNLIDEEYSKQLNPTKDKKRLKELSDIWWKNLSQQEKDLYESLVRAGPFNQNELDNLESKLNENNWSKQNIEYAKEYYELDKPIRREDLGSITDRAAIAFIQSKGIDGFVYKNEVEDIGSESWVAMYPEQVKSATANVGTFDSKNIDIRYSTAKDKEYIDALEKGDTDTLQKIVNEVAKNSGYIQQVYHGSVNNFTKFREKFSGIWTAFEESAASPGSGENPLYKMNLFADPGDNSVSLTEDQFKEWQHSTSPLNWIRKYIEQNQYKDGKFNRITSVKVGDYALVLRNANQLKSSDPIVKDNKGNVIPPSQRFNKESKDIRFSTAPPSSETQFTEIPDFTHRARNLANISKVISGLRKKKKEAKLNSQERKAYDMLKNIKWRYLGQDEIDEFVNLLENFVETRSKGVPYPEFRHVPDDVIDKISLLSKDATDREIADIIEDNPDVFEGVDSSVFTSVQQVKEFLRDSLDLTDFESLSDIKKEKSQDQIELEDSLDFIVAEIRENLLRYENGVINNEGLIELLGLQTPQPDSPLYERFLPIMDKIFAKYREAATAYAEMLVDTDYRSLSYNKARHHYYELLALQSAGSMFMFNRYIQKDLKEIIEGEYEFRNPLTGTFDAADKAKKGISSFRTKLDRLAGNQDARNVLNQIVSPFRESLRLAKEMELEMANFAEERVNVRQKQKGKDFTTSELEQIGIFGIARNIHSGEEVKEGLLRNRDWIQKSINNYSKSYKKAYRQSAKAQQEFLNKLFDGVEDSDSPLEKLTANAQELIGDAGIGLADDYSGFFEYTKPLASFATRFFYGREYNDVFNYLPSFSIPIGSSAYRDETLLSMDAGAMSAGVGQVPVNGAYKDNGMTSTFERERKLASDRALIFNINHLFQNRGRLNMLDYITASERRSIHNLTMTEKFSKFLGDEGKNSQLGRVSLFKETVRSMWMNNVTSVQYASSLHELMTHMTRKWGAFQMSGVHQFFAQTASAMMGYASSHFINPARIWNLFDSTTKLFQWRLDPTKKKLLDQILFDIRNRSQDITLDRNADLSAMSEDLMTKLKQNPLMKGASKISEGIEKAMFLPFKWADFAAGDTIMFAEYIWNEKQRTGVVDIDDVTEFNPESYNKALDETERHIGIGDKSRRAEILANNKWYMSVLRMMSFAFATHALNNISNFQLAVKDLADGNLSVKERAQAATYAIGIAAQSATFIAVRNLIKITIAGMLLKAFADFDTEGEEEEKKIAELTAQKEKTSGIEAQMIESEIQLQKELIRIKNNVNKNKNERIRNVNFINDLSTQMFLSFNMTNGVSWATHMLFDKGQKEMFEMDKAVKISELKKKLEGNISPRKEVEILTEINLLEAQQFIDASPLYNGGGLPLASGILPKTLGQIGKDIGAIPEKLIDGEDLTVTDLTSVMSLFGIGQADISNYLRTREKISAVIKENEERIRKIEERERTRYAN